MNVGASHRRMKARHVLDVDALTASELAEVVALARRSPPEPALAGQGVALLFEKASARTRNSAEMAVVRLGGHPVTIRGVEVGLGTRESIEDVARTLACYHAVIGARVFEHSALADMAGALDAAGAPVPVVNLLSDVAHPCQAIADVMTLQEAFAARGLVDGDAPVAPGGLAGRAVAFVGDANNVFQSLALACAMASAELRLACPADYQPHESFRSLIAALGGELVVVEEPAEAVAGADAIYTDTWVSMGQEDDAFERRAAFAAYRVDASLLAAAPRHAVVLHCLPAHRGEEIAGEVLDGPVSVVWRQAANRMHAIRGLLWWLARSGAHAWEPGA